LGITIVKMTELMFGVIINIIFRIFKYHSKVNFRIDRFIEPEILAKILYRQFFLHVPIEIIVRDIIYFMRTKAFSAILAGIKM
jgi:hypothetical protein